MLSHDIGTKVNGDAIATVRRAVVHDNELVARVELAGDAREALGE
jgi:hypothetical protein